jgi:predicted amidohydrolase
MTVRKVAAAQLGPASSDKAETVARMVDLLDQAGRQGVEFVVFPELSVTPYFAGEIRADVASFAEKPFPSEQTAPLIEAIRRHHITTVVPFAEDTRDGLFNSAALIDGTGKELGRYRKMHIPGTVDVDPAKPFQILEKRYFKPGDLGFPAYDSPVGPVGMAICYDRRFPETFRCLGLSGAEIYAVVFNTPYNQAEDNARARSIEAHELAVRCAARYNGVPAIAAGKAGVEGGLPFIGASSVISHTGDVLARSTSDGDDLVVAEIDFAAAAEERARLDLANNRRTDQYSAITADYSLAGSLSQ